MKKLICAVLILSLLLTLSSCSQNNSFSVIKSLKMDGATYLFDYNSEKSCVTVSIKEAPGSTILIFVNQDSAITSIYMVESDTQYCLFEESRSMYPKTTYNDANEIASKPNTMIPLLFTRISIMILNFKGEEEK